MMGSLGNFRTIMAVPLRQQGELIGGLMARRTEVHPFTPVQIKLLETFAEQAVIAIENARLFQELKEALEQQTATSEILGVIASSPTDLQPVLDAVAENAARLCDALDAAIYRRSMGNTSSRLRALWTSATWAGPSALARGLPTGRGHFRSSRQSIFMISWQYRKPSFQMLSPCSHNSPLAHAWPPLLREGAAIRLFLFAVRKCGLSPKQIKLLETFAAQAVIAIENVRLFKEIQERNAELREALEHQTATAEVLGIISRSPTGRAAGTRCNR
jgi:GAF domain-containing protein